MSNLSQNIALLSGHIESLINAQFKSQVTVNYKESQSISATEFLTARTSLHGFYVLSNATETMVLGFDRSILIHLASQLLGCDSSAFLKQADTLSLFEQFLEQEWVRAFKAILDDLGLDFEIENQGESRKNIGFFMNYPQFYYAPFQLSWADQGRGSFHLCYQTLSSRSQL